MAKCPPGVLCLNWGAIGGVVAVIVILVLAYVAFAPSMMWTNVHGSRAHSAALAHSAATIPPADPVVVEREIVQTNAVGFQQATNPVYVTMVPPSHFLVPPAPERISGDLVARAEMPMAIATNGGPGPYQQVGVMRKDDTDDELMPLFGRMLQSNRQKWNYYTMKEGAGTLPVRFKNRDCMDRYVGCDELYDGDGVTVDALSNRAYRVMMYETGPFY